MFWFVAYRADISRLVGTLALGVGSEQPGDVLAA